MIKLIPNARLLSRQREVTERLEGVQRLRRTICIPHTQKFESKARQKTDHSHGDQMCPRTGAKGLKIDFWQPILLLEDTISPNFAYKTNSFTDQAHFRQHMKRNRTGEVDRPATM
jgi:hypothetical protein